MEYLLAIGLIFVIVWLIMPKEEGTKLEGASAKLVIEKKKCPPHQWFWQEIVDQDGNKQGERIVCKVCGPLKFNGGGDDESRPY